MFIIVYVNSFHCVRMHNRCSYLMSFEIRSGVCAISSIVGDGHLPLSVKKYTTSPYDMLKRRRAQNLFEKEAKHLICSNFSDLHFFASDHISYEVIANINTLPPRRVFSGISSGPLNGPESSLNTTDSD